MNRDPSTFVFHWDATYKINSIGYLVLICGITDPGGKFHPVAFFLIGRESTDEYEWAMTAVMDVYQLVVGSALRLHYVMGDAALAPVAAIKMLPQLNVQTILMFFYLCVAAVNKRLGAVPTRLKALVAFHMFNMHYSRSPTECRMHWASATEAWGACDILVAKDFVRYFAEQWMTGDFCKWQVYHTPSGFPTTNNPCELFNKHVKGTFAAFTMRTKPRLGTYTQRSLHGLCATFKLLGSIAEEYSTVKITTFTSEVSPSEKLVRRSRRLITYNLLEVVPPNPDLEHVPGTVRIVGIVPRHAISHARESDAVGTTVAMEAGRPTETSPEHLEVANAYYYNENTNNIRHESICAGNAQPSYGWQSKNEMSMAHHCLQQHLSVTKPIEPRQRRVSEVNADVVQ
ncbi:hypothetical protein DYB38_013031 [Aphanomyces astaci]|uniref:MULE transposase domain-containing protein n=1 Tax=Aphanomyces astaci TaxID=112090 RepID=A0A397E0M6_APHAT|nr:hypothetical protein DYB38_013031 [Aphanomyces astaci]